MSVFSLFAIAVIAAIGYFAGVDIYAAITFGFFFSIIYSFFGLFFGDRVALTSTGAKPITKSDNPTLYNLVENLSITAGLPMPKVYIINDPAPNAFATGRDPKNASVAFTTGILELLDKSELEGVVAHELSHVKNFDIRIMTLVVVLAGLIAITADVLLRISFYSKIDRDNKQAGIIMLVVMIALAILAPIAAQMIKFAVSRSREYLADASGALLTRYPEGLASALQKISTYSKPMKGANHATAHLFISSPFGPKEKKAGIGAKFNGLFATHPPVEQRIQKLREMGG